MYRVLDLEAVLLDDNDICIYKFKIKKKNKKGTACSLLLRNVILCIRTYVPPQRMPNNLQAPTNCQSIHVLIYAYLL